MILSFRSVVYHTNWTGFRGAGQSCEAQLAVYRAPHATRANKRLLPSNSLNPQLSILKRI